MGCLDGDGNEAGEDGVAIVLDDGRWFDDDANHFPEDEGLALEPTSTTTFGSIHDPSSGTVLVDEAVLGFPATPMTAHAAFGVLDVLIASVAEGTVDEDELWTITERRRLPTGLMDKAAARTGSPVRTSRRADGSLHWTFDGLTGRRHTVPDGVLREPSAWTVRSLVALFLLASKAPNGVIEGTEGDVATSLHLRTGRGSRHGKWRERLAHIVSRAPVAMGVQIAVSAVDGGGWDDPVSIRCTMPRMGRVPLATHVEPRWEAGGPSMDVGSLDVAGWVRDGGGPGASVGWLPLAEHPGLVADPVASRARYDTAWHRGAWVARRDRTGGPVGGTVPYDVWSAAVRMGTACDDADLHWTFVIDPPVDPVRLSVDVSNLLEIVERPWTSWFQPFGIVLLDAVVETGVYRIAPRSFPGLPSAVLSAPGVVRPDRVRARDFHFRGTMERGWMHVRRTVRSMSTARTEAMRRWLQDVVVPRSSPIALVDLVRGRRHPVVPVVASLLRDVPVPVPLPPGLGEPLTNQYRCALEGGVPVLQNVERDENGRPTRAMVVLRPAPEAKGTRVHTGRPVHVVSGDMCAMDGGPFEPRFAASFDTDWLSAIAAEVGTGAVLVRPWVVPDAFGTQRAPGDRFTDPLSLLPLSYQATVDGVRRDVRMTLVRSGDDAMIRLVTAPADTVVVPDWLAPDDAPDDAFNDDAPTSVEDDAVPSDTRGASEDAALAFEDELIRLVVDGPVDSDPDGFERSTDVVPPAPDDGAACVPVPLDGAEPDVAIPRPTLDPDETLSADLYAEAVSSSDGVVSERVVAALARNPDVVRVAAVALGRMAGCRPPTHLPAADLVSVWMCAMAHRETCADDVRAVLVGLVGTSQVSDGPFERPARGLPRDPLSRARYVHRLLTGWDVGLASLPRDAVDAVCGFLEREGDPVVPDDLVPVALSRPGGLPALLAALTGRRRR